MCNMIALSLREDLNLDPTIAAYCEIEAALDETEAARGDDAQHRTDRHYDECLGKFADTVPTSIQGCARKAEMSSRWIELLEQDECEHGSIMSELFRDLLQRNADTLAEGIEALTR